VDQVLGNRYTISHLGRLPLPGGRWWICSPGMFSAGKLSKRLDMNSAWRPWKLLLTVGESHRSSTPIRVSVHSGGLVARLKTEEIRFRLVGRGRCYETLLWTRLWRGTVKYEEVYLRAYSVAGSESSALFRFLWRY